MEKNFKIKQFFDGINNVLRVRRLNRQSECLPGVGKDRLGVEITGEHLEREYRCGKADPEHFWDRKGKHVFVQPMGEQAKMNAGAHAACAASALLDVGFGDPLCGEKGAALFGRVRDAAVHAEVDDIA